MKYPHVVIRWMACAYGWREVTLGTDRPEGGAAYAIPSRFLMGATLTPEGRQYLVDLVQQDVWDTGHRMCVVFGPTDSIYVEPDRAPQVSATPPSGGIRIDSIKVCRPEDC